MTIKSKKAQIISFEFSASFIIFLIFMIVFIGLILFNNGTKKKQEFELDYVFANFENNLRYDLPDRGFFMNYRVNKVKLGNFASTIGANSIDSFVVGNITNTHGIGLDDEAYDVCLYFIDNNNSLIALLPGPPETFALGRLDKTLTSCSEEITGSKNPCEGYSQAISFFKPVLFDEDDKTKNRIVQMNIVLCKK